MLQAGHGILEGLLRGPAISWASSKSIDSSYDLFDRIVVVLDMIGYGTSPLTFYQDETSSGVSSYYGYFDFVKPRSL